MENQRNEGGGLSRSAFKEWLEKLQQESWQLELLISGFALFGIWEAKSLVGSIHDFREINPPSSDYLAQSLEFIEHILSIGWRLFFFNLLIHVISRGLWIGAIGLRYVSSDINFKVFNYSAKFEEYLAKKVGSFDDYIERLERFSSVIFAYTFLMFFLFMSFMVFWFWIMFLTILATKAIGTDPTPMGGIIFIVMMLFILLIVILALIVLVDFITLGALKRVKDKGFSSAYFYLFRFFSIITLSFLYRPLLYNFLDEKYTKRLFLFSIPYIIIIALIPSMHSSSSPFYPIDSDGRIYEEYQAESYRNYYYDDERAASFDPKDNFFNLRKPINHISLESSELTGDYGKLFIRSISRDRRLLEKGKQLDPYYKEGILFPFQKNNKKDSITVDLNEQMEQALADILETRRSLRKKIKNGEISTVQTGITNQNGQLKLDDRHWQSQRDSVRHHYLNIISSKKRDKIHANKLALLELNNIFIDDIPYTDSLSCKFYVHPNMGERGLLCYFPLDSLESGPHLLHFNKKDYNITLDSLKIRYRIDIPFFIRKKE